MTAQLTAQRVLRFIWFGILVLVSASLLAETGRAAAQQAAVHVLTVQGVINPVQARYLTRGIESANAAGAAAIVIKLDTPGGLDTSMREIVQAILASPAPVIVWVAPSGARAASAGMFIALAAPIAAMAPNTAIGAATPVASSGESVEGDLRAKAVNDAAAYARDLAERNGRNADWADRAIREAISASSREAVELKVVDFIATDLDSLLAQSDGRTVPTALGTVRVRTSGAAVVDRPMGAVERLLLILTDPTIAALLLGIAGLAIFIELQNPGAIVPGVVGVIALIVGLFGLGTLPLNIAALALAILGLVLLGLEAYTASGGVLGVGGAIALGVGLLLMVDSPAPYLQVSRPAILGVVVGLTAAVLILSWFGARTRRVPVTTGKEALIGATGVVRSPLAPAGMVFVEGELWEAVADTPLEPGARVRVVAIDGLTLKVEPAGPEPTRK
ncbi:MAG: nodulation protein NfeD [Chloroflexota bacterium]|nr:nodulation protein NfeD [Dehalococcoidia bacterium]MDW8255247.1 nodulation protein NfeD [Chloroflexota bacterium]